MVVFHIHKLAIGPTFSPMTIRILNLGSVLDSPDSPIVASRRIFSHVV